MFVPEKCLLNSNISFKQQLQHFILLISIILTSIKDGACFLPEASEEGALRSFETYNDVVVFHYSVPKQIIRATWQFAAFADNSKCPRRKVNIYLKWGSYPIIYKNNATYPHNMYVDDRSTIKKSTVTEFEPKSMTIVAVYSPQPGDWFIGAYLSPWDKKVQIKGLGHECQYSLGSIATWSETTDIENIPLGYQKTMKTSEIISYYKIYIPMDTGSFQVDIWGCNTTIVQNFHGPCIKSIVLKGRVLPYYNHSDSSAILNLTTMGTYTHTESSPYQDSWYYLMVVSNTKIYFDIKVTVFECPVKTMEEGYLSQHIDAPFYLKTSQIYLNNFKELPLQWYSINQDNIKQNSITTSDKQINIGNNDDNSNSCILRHQMVRIKNIKPFSGEYLLQRKQWFTSWLALTDTVPVALQFDVLPLIDIGGTLVINISLNENEFLKKHQVNVNICLNRGHMPHHAKGRITCDNKNMTMHLSSINKQNSSLLIPYPQPDTWYIALQATCYANNMPTRCEMKDILVSISVKLRSCIFEGEKSCGSYGVCQEVKDRFLYSFCQCFGGRQGWACTDTRNAMSNFQILFAPLILTFSNLSFIPAIYIALKRKYYTEGFIYFFTMLFSGLYHACDQPITTYCVAKYDVLQYCDYFSGILSFWVTNVAVADVPVQYISLYHMLGAMIITFLGSGSVTGLASVAVPLLTGILIPIISYSYYCYKMKKCMLPKRMLKLVIGTSLAGFGILLFSLVETESNYKYVHSCWHVIIAVSLIFLLPPMREEKSLNSSTANELLNYKDSPDNSVFNIENNQRASHLIADIS